jgi:hypothetical protein
MKSDLMRREYFEWEGEVYLVQVSRRPDGHPHCSHMAVTVFGPDDCIIHDGASVAEVLQRQLMVLPLAILSRAILADTAARRDAVPAQEDVRLEKSPAVKRDRKGRAVKRSGKPSGRGQSRRRLSGKAPENGLHLHVVPFGSNNTEPHPSA